MATATNIVFKIPQEPHPLPSLESDEESFVVLGQSIPDVSTEVYSEVVGLPVIAEAKRLLNNELETIGQTKNDEKNNSLVDANKDLSIKSLSEMETSGLLPTMPHIDKGLDSHNAVSIVSLTADMSSEEVQNKIAQLIDENIRLKDTVLQNNMSLKSQYERIVAWQEDVQKVHQAHKEKLLEAKGFLETLKREKDMLKHDLAKVIEERNQKDIQLEELKRQLKEKNTVTQEVLLQRSDDNMKEFQLDVANKKIKDLEAELDRLVQQNIKFTSEIVEFDNQAEDKAKKLSALEAELQKLRMENSCLSDKEEKLKIQQDENHEKISEMKPELEKLIKARDYANKKVEELKNEISAIQNAATQREESSIITINSLIAQLKMKENQDEEINNLRTQLTQTQTSLTQMEYTRAQAYSQVNQLTVELSNLRSELETLRSQEERNSQSTGGEDDVFVLKTQLDLYKTDFEEERRAREVIKGEKDRLEEDLQNIQRRNQQLQEEIELLRNNSDFVVYPTSRPSQASRQASAPPIPMTPVFECPKCNFKFNNIQTLEAHVHRCLELDDHLP